MGDLTKDFSAYEFQCPCGCGRSEMDSAFVRQLQCLRDLYGPLKINSGFRCAEHNRAVGGGPESSHLDGLAADINCRSSYDRFRLVSMAFLVGFARIGIGTDFVHVDTDPLKPRRLLWLYP